MSEYDVSRANEFFRAKTAFTTGTHELERMINGTTDPATYQVVDVRYPVDFAKSRVSGAVNLPKPDWKNPGGLNKNAILYLYCYTPTCHLAAEAAVELTAQGYKVVEVEGGWERWLQDGFDVEDKAA